MCLPYSSSYLQASPLCEAYWLGMWLCLYRGNKDAEGKANDSEGAEERIECVCMLVVQRRNKRDRGKVAGLLESDRSKWE